MATFALTDASIYIDGYDFSTDSNQVALTTDAEELDDTTFGPDYRSRIAGLKNVALEYAGNWDSIPDDAIFSSLGTKDDVYVVGPTSAEDTTSFMFKAGKFSYESFGAIGEVTPFTVGASGTNREGLVRGRLALAKSDVSTTGAVGSGVSLGTVSSGQYLYAALQVFSVGTTITVDVESDSASDFSTATTRIAGNAITSTGGVWYTRLAGPISDSFFRFNVSAVTGTFSLAGAIGVGS